MYCDEYGCSSVCLSARICPKPHSRTSSNFLCMLIASARGSVLLWQHCDTLCTSGFVDDVMFSHNGPYGASRVFICGESACNSLVHGSR